MGVPPFGHQRRIKSACAAGAWRFYAPIDDARCMVRVFPRVHSAERLPDRADGAGSRVADTMRQCFPALAFAAAWVSAGTVLIALLMLLGAALTR
jgi:hypothetical protein